MENNLTKIALAILKGEKIVRGRHYTDPALSYEYVSKKYDAIGKIPSERITD